MSLWKTVGIIGLGLTGLGGVVSGAAKIGETVESAEKEGLFKKSEDKNDTKEKAE